MKVNEWVRFTDRKQDMGLVGRIMAVNGRSKRVTVRWEDGKLLEHPSVELQVVG
jgi:hypothetical protein